MQLAGDDAGGPKVGKQASICLWRMLAGLVQVGDADLHENYALLKMYIVRALTPDGIANLGDHKVAELATGFCLRFLCPG